MFWTKRLFTYLFDTHIVYGHTRKLYNMLNLVLELGRACVDKKPRQDDRVMRNGRCRDIRPGQFERATLRRRQIQ